MTSPDVVAIVLAGGASSRFGSDKLAASLDGRPLLHHALEAVGEVTGSIVIVIAPEAPVPSVPEGLGSRVVIARDVATHGGPLAGLAAGLAAMLTAADTPVRDEAPHITGAGEKVTAADTPVRDEAPHITGAGVKVTATDTPVRDEAPHITGTGEKVAATAGATVAVAATAGATAGATAWWEAGWDGVVLVVGGDMPSLVPAVLRLLATTLAADSSLAVMTLAASGPAPLPMAVRPNAARAAIDAILRSGGRRSLLALADAVPSATLPEEAWRAIDPGGATLRDVDAPDDLAGG